MLLPAFTAILLALAVLIPDATAAQEPTGDFATFANCPRHTKGVELCVYSQIENGRITLNNATLNISKPIVLQGGIVPHHSTQESFVGALDGDTLTTSPQKIPNGLPGFCHRLAGGTWQVTGARWACQLVFEGPESQVDVAIELAKSASQIHISTEALEDAYGPAISLPIKVHLVGPMLGGECDIGSASNPIELKLTDGKTSPALPNQPISGKIGRLRLKDEYEFAEDRGGTLVDNSFSVPGARNCGGSLSTAFDNAIDHYLGLPSSDGHNSVVLRVELLEGGTHGVTASER